MKNTITTIMLLILSIILININIYELLYNPITIILLLAIISIIVIILTYVSSSLIIPLTISSIPLLLSNAHTQTYSLFITFSNVFIFFKNSIMLLDVLSVILFKIIIEKKIPRDPLLRVKEILKYLHSTNSSKRLLVIISEMFIAIGIFFYISYIITIFFGIRLGIFYVSGVIISSLFLILGVVNKLGFNKNLLITTSSWFSPIIFLAILSDVQIKSEPTRIFKEGIYLGEIKAKLEFAKGSLRAYTFSEHDKSISMKEEWIWIKTSGKYYYNPLVQENPHILIVGSSGTGKSTIASILSYELYDRMGASIVIIDFHGEYHNLINRLYPYSSINMNIIDTIDSKISLLDIMSGYNIKEKSLEISTIIQRVFNLGPLQKIFLQKIIEEAYTIIAEEKEGEGRALLRAYRIVLDNVQTDQELRTIKSLEPYIKALASEFFSDKTVPLQKIFSGFTIIDLSQLYSEQFKNLYAELILLKIYDNLSVINRELRKLKYVIVDEAHRIAKERDCVLAKIVAESRKYHVGVMVITQHPKSISEDIIGNTSLQIVFQLKEPTNLEYIAKMLAGYQASNRVDSIRRAIYYLPRFHGLLKDSLIREPLLIDFTRKPGDRNG